MISDGDYQIDRARPGDAPELARVYVETWRSAYAGILPARVLLNMQTAIHEVRFARWIGQQNGKQFVLTARVDGHRIAGLASAGHARGHARTTGEIYTLYVDPDWQGLGIGKDLLKTSLRRLSGAGFRKAILWVLAENPSRFFYEAHGGVRAAERVERLWNTDLREISYHWTTLPA